MKTDFVSARQLGAEASYTAARRANQQNHPVSQQRRVVGSWGIALLVLLQGAVPVANGRPGAPWAPYQDVPAFLSLSTVNAVSVTRIASYPTLDIDYRVQTYDGGSANSWTCHRGEQADLWVYVKTVDKGSLFTPNSISVASEGYIDFGGGWHSAPNQHLSFTPSSQPFSMHQGQWDWYAFAVTPGTSAPEGTYKVRISISSGVYAVTGYAYVLVSALSSSQTSSQLRPDLMFKHAITQTSLNANDSLTFTISLQNHAGAEDGSGPNEWSNGIQMYLENATFQSVDNATDFSSYAAFGLSGGQMPGVSGATIIEFYRSTLIHGSPRAATVTIRADNKPGDKVKIKLMMWASDPYEILYNPLSGSKEQLIVRGMGYSAPANTWTSAKPRTTGYPLSLLPAGLQMPFNGENFDFRAPARTSESVVEIPITAPNNPPNDPVVSSPPNGATNQPLTPTLSASAFRDPDAGDTHAATRWLILENSYAVYDSGEDAPATSKTVPSGKLSYSRTYVWYVAYKDNRGEWSGYDWASFTTQDKPNTLPNTPCHVSPVDGATDQPLTPTLQASAFSDPDVGDTHTASHWIVALMDGTVVYNSYEDVPATSKVVPASKLDYSTTYKWTVYYKDNHNDWSCGIATTFTTQASPPPPPVAIPTIVPSGGTYVGSVDVTIQTSTVGASIRYTTDGSTPSSTHGLLINGNRGIATMTSSCIVKAMAFKSGMTDSSVTEADPYTIIPRTRIIGLSGDLSFGNVRVGNTDQRTLTISNTGNSTLNISSISYPSGFSGAWSGSIAPSDSKDVTVTFTPTAAQSYGGPVTVNSDKTSGGDATSASGTGTSPDTQGPTVVIISPPNATVVSNPALTVSGIASDSGLGNNGVSSVTVNGVNATGGTAAGANTANWSATITLNPGANTITVVANDMLNNAGQQQITVTYMPDTQGPAVTINSPMNGATVTNPTLTISGTATDSGRGNSGVSSVTVNGVPADGGTATGANTANWSGPMITLNRGANTITVVANDTLNNSTTISIIVIYNPPDTQAPTLVISSPANGATVNNASLIVSGTASDSGRGNNGVLLVTVNGTTATGGTSAGGNTANWSATVTLNPGPNTITVLAKDTLNNASQQQIIVTYPYIPPALSRNPASLTPSCTQGQNAASQSFEVWNSGGGTLSYSISDDAAWLSVTPASGTSTGEHDTIQVNYSTSGLLAGTYNATITITGSDDAGSPQTIPVTLTVKLDLPDMVMQTLSVTPKPIRWGDTITWSGTVKNQGTRDAPAFSVCLYLSADATISTNDFRKPDGFDSIAVPSLATGATYSISPRNFKLPSTPPPGFSATGTYYFGTILDVGNGVPESNESNNSNVGLGIDKVQALFLAPETGSLQVTLVPADVAARAHWRVDGGAWQTNNATVSDLTVGNHTVSFEGIASVAMVGVPSWKAPADQIVYINAGQTNRTSGTYTKFGINNPPDGFTFNTGTVTFSWDAVSGATQYALWIGTTPGSYNLKAVALSGRSYTATLPANGSKIYVRLWALVNGTWQQVNDYTYTAATPTKARITGPTDGTALSSGTATFTWDAGAGVTQYALWVGSAAGTWDLYAGLQSSLSRTLTLPTDGRTLYVTLLSYINGAWQQNAYTYTAHTAPIAEMVSPTQGSTLTGDRVEFQWTTIPGAAYALWVGTTINGYNLYAGTETGQSRTVKVPTDGKPLYVTLWTYINGQWRSNAYTYTAYTATGPEKALLNSPADGTTLNGDRVNFQWSSGVGVTRYALWAGTNPNSYDLSAAFESGLSRTVKVPTNGKTIYVTLLSYINGAWQTDTRSYTAYTKTLPETATMLTPVPNSTLAGAATKFSWASGVKASSTALWVGTTPAGYDLCAGSESGLWRALMLPKDGRRLYVTLWSLINGAWHPSPCEYTAFTSP